MSDYLNIGDKIPPFCCKDEDGHEVTQDDILGGPAVIYFYPKDDTPGCTKEACAFRDNWNRLEQTDTVVLGVNADSPESHRAFIEKHHLNFTLLSDADKTMCKSFGVLVDGKITRATFVITPDGVISWIEQPVSVEGHVDRVLQALKASA